MASLSGNPDLPSQVIRATREATVGTSSMRFPAEHGRYYCIMQFVVFDRKNPKQVAQLSEQGNVVLPLPINLREYYSASYNDVDFGPLGGGVDVTDKLIGDYMSGGGMTNGLIDDAMGAATDFSKAMARRTVNYISQDAGSLIDITTAQVVNPHITSVFRGMPLREHVFNWRLNAKSSDESQTLRTIINYVRDHMTPTKKGDFLLNMPDEVYVKFYADGKPFLYPIFKCVVTSVDVPSSSDATNAFFKGTDEPVIIDLSITFREVESVTREDYTANTSTSNSSPSIETPTNQAGTAPGPGARGF